MSESEWSQLEQTIASLGPAELVRLRSLIVSAMPPNTERSNLVGLFADEPALVDAVQREAMQSRELHPLRVDEP